MLLPKNTVGGEHSRADARAHARVLSLMKLYHSPTASQDAGGITPPHPASRSARVRRRAPLLGGRLACRAIAPYHVVKMRDARSLRVFNEDYPLSRSFSLHVVGVLYPHTPLRGYYILALPRRDPRVFVAVRRSSAGGSPVARSLLITS